MAVPEGPNIYDVQGTVLYRVVSRDDNEAEMQGRTAIDTDPLVGSPLGTITDGTSTASAAGVSGASGSAANSGALVGGGFSIAARYGPLGNPLASTMTKKPPRLAPIGSAEGGAATVTAATGTYASGSGGQSALTVERALAQLFTPAPLDNKVPNSTMASNGEFLEAAGPSNPFSDTVGNNERGLTTTGGNPYWLKAASIERTSRLGVVLLQQHLERRCKDEHARPRGVLCPIRERIFDDAFKELTRQATTLCPERGLLLEELSRGMAQSTETYDILFDSACQYAVRKSIERDLRSYLFDEKKALESEVRRLDNRVNELRAKYEGMMKRFEEQKAAAHILHEEEIAYMKKANQQLISEIKRLSALESAMNS